MFSEEDTIEVTSMIVDILNLKSPYHLDKIKNSSLYKGIFIIREFLNADNPNVFTFNNEHDNNLFKEFLFACIVDYVIHGLSVPEIKFNLNDSKEINYKKILNVKIDAEQAIVLILLRIRNGQHFKFLTSGEEYYSITEDDNEVVCAEVLNDIFNTIVVEEELLGLDTSDIEKYRSFNVTLQFNSTCKIIDKCGIWNDNRLDILIKDASKNRYSPAGYLFTKLFTKFLSIYTRYPSQTVHKIIILFEYYSNVYFVEFDEKEKMYIYTEKFINVAKKITENVFINKESIKSNKFETSDSKMDVFDFAQDKNLIIQ